MSHLTDDELCDVYLWDPRAEAHDAVVALERRLAVFRFDPERRALVIPAGQRSTVSTSRLLTGLALAAGILIAAGWSLAAWRWSWPVGQAWPVKTSTIPSAAPLAVGSTLQVSAGQETVVGIARIGTMRVRGDSTVTLRTTSSNRHRLTMEKGAIHVRVWAPPMSVMLQTPSGSVSDLGCEFELRVSRESSAVRVISGWVQLENGVDETLVPAGASSEMTSSSAPGVPVYDDASAQFREAVRTLERSSGNTDETVQQIVKLARRRDVLTLLMLVWRNSPGMAPLAARAAELWPPPAGVTVSAVVGGDREAFWRWHSTLPLPSPKNWLRNWRDAF
jgi:hypothetical protein